MVSRHNIWVLVFLLRKLRSDYFLVILWISNGGHRRHLELCGVKGSSRCGFCMTGKGSSSQDSEITSSHTVPPSETACSYYALIIIPKSIQCLQMHSGRHTAHLFKLATYRKGRPGKSSSPSPNAPMSRSRSTNSGKRLRPQRPSVLKNSLRLCYHPYQLP
jgi:hypothetical protein